MFFHLALDLVVWNGCADFLEATSYVFWAGGSAYAGATGGHGTQEMSLNGFRTIVDTASNDSL